MVGADPNRLLKVVLIEDSSLLCQALGDVLDEMAGVKVVGQAEDEGSAIELLQREQPHLAIVDLQLRTGSGLGVLRALRGNPGQFGSPCAVVFSSHGEASVRARCFALGVERFFDKTTQVGELLAYVRQAIPS